jgi:probable rRNA maturation factor
VNKPKINFLINRKLFPVNINISDFRRVVRLISSEVMKSESQMVNIINLNFCTDLDIRKINSKFLRHDYETDIITFRYDEKDYSESDIMISVETVIRNSFKYKSSFINEACRVIIHGLLHLCGFEDSNRAQKQKMRTKENFYLNKLMSKGII